MMALTHEEAKALLAEIGAIERSNTLKDILGNIEQTFGGQPLYPAVESRAAHLLYFIVRNHALLDDTKRGAEAVFQEYIMRNGLPVLPHKSLAGCWMKSKLGVAERIKSASLR
jgi:prophage maintenance system killer protein